jgi:D-cysteine desulfhydrase
MDAAPVPAPLALGTWPTPVERAPRLAAALGLGAGDLWIKRDDLTGLGGGGNKVRKLEWLCGAALDEGADTLVTSGAPQSNHARLTAAAAARLGLNVVLVLAGTEGTGGNLALGGLLGAQIVWAGAIDDTALAARAAEVVEQLREAGARPYLIPFGGTNALGATGYVEGGREIHGQASGLSTVVTALGSGGTMAGLVRALGPDRVLGIHCGAVENPIAAVADLCSALSGSAFPAERLQVRLDQVGAGYATLTEPVLAALTLAARTEGIVFDPIYTGRALSGLIAAVADGQIRPGARTVLLHSGGLPGLFGHPATLERSTAALVEFGRT